MASFTYLQHWMLAVIVDFLIQVCYVQLSEVPLPQFTIIPKDSIGLFYEAQTVTFNCSASGVNPGSYRWFKEDKVQSKQTEVNPSSDSRYSISTLGVLTITNSNHDSDNAYYLCVASNSLGSIISPRADLKLIYFRPPTSTNTVDVPASTGYSKKYQFETSQSYPPAMFSWKKGSTSILENDRITFSKDGFLYIGKVEFSDAGKYYSQVWNPVLGTKYNRQVINLSVVGGTTAEVKSFFLAPVTAVSDHIAILGKKTEITLECIGSGNPLPTISWKKDGQSINAGSKYVFGSYNKRLTIKNIVSLSDSGTFECYITNPIHNYLNPRKLKLIVSDVPVFTLKPLATTGYLQSSMTLKCQASGPPDDPPKITWYKNAVQIINNTHQVIDDKTHSLMVNNLVMEDAGMYQCAASNFAGQILADANVVIKEIPPKITKGPKDIKQIVGATITLDCEYTGVPKPTRTWSRDGLVLVAGGRFIFLSTGSLQIINTEKLDSGKYKCSVVNNAGVANATAVVAILVKTVIIKRMPPVFYATKGSKAELPCEVQKDPSVQITHTWTKDDQPVNFPRASVNDDGNLEIQNVQDGDQGVYACRVESAAGNDSTSGSLQVQELPLAPTRPVVQEVKSRSLFLNWKPPGYDGNSQILHYKVSQSMSNGPWTVLPNYINPASDIKAYLDKLSPYTEYSFKVCAVNSIGAGDYSTPSKVTRTQIEAPSAAPDTVTAMPASQTSILVQWKIPPAEHHNGPLKGYYIAYRLAGYPNSSFVTKIANGGSTIQLIIDGLILWTQYDIKVQAFNDAGTGPFSTTISEWTAQGVPTAAPDQLKVSVLSSTSILCTWVPPPQKLRNGWLRGHVIQVWEPSNPSAIQETSILFDGSNAAETGNVTNLKKYTQYSVAVLAYNDAGRSPPSGAVQIRTEEGVPDAPGSFSVYEVYDNTIRVRWDQPSNPNGNVLNYILKYWKNATSPNKIQLIINATDVSFAISGLRPLTTYIVELAARTIVGTGTYVNLQATTGHSPVPPEAPSKPQFVIVNSTFVSLRWTEGFKGRAPLTKYTIQYIKDPSFSNSQWKLGHVVNNPYQIYNLFPLKVPGLQPFTTYRFRVIAQNRIGSSPPGNASDDIRTAEDVPSLPPQEMTVTVQSSSEFALSWKIPPKSSWNSVSIGYAIYLTPLEYNGGVSSIRVPNSQATYYFTSGLEKFTKYRVTMKTYNAIGEDKNGKSVEAMTHEDVPDQGPSPITPVVNSATQITLNWGAVPSAGQNGQILGYNVFYQVQGNQHSKKEVTIDGGNVRSKVLTNLQSFAIYEIQMSAFTKLGNGVKSDVVTAQTKESTPGPPVRITFPYITLSYIRVKWDPPVFPNGIIINYRVFHKKSSSNSWTSHSVLSSSTLQYSVSNLGGGVKYDFRIEAKTTMGFGTPAIESVLTSVVREAPQAPLILQIADSDVTKRSIRVRWSVRTEQNPIRYFTLDYSDDKGGWVVYSNSISSSLRNLLVEGLLPGHEYKFRMMATNDVSDSAYSAVSASVKTQAEAPTGAPRNVRIKALSTRSLLVEWVPPLPEQLGGPLKGYILNYRKKTQSSWENKDLAPDLRRFTIVDLQIATTYEISLYAYNDQGDGPSQIYESTTGELAPKNPPRNARTGKVTKTSVTIYWDAPIQDSGSIQGYKVMYSEVKARRRRRSLSTCPTPPSDRFIMAPANANQATVDNLRKYITYTLSVRAFNSAGESPDSGAVTVKTLPDIPGPPNELSYDSYQDSVHLAWLPPCEPNGEITEYHITYWKVSKQNKFQKSVSGSALSVIIDGLSMLSKYTFQVKAKTSGYGPAITAVVDTKGMARLPFRPARPEVSMGSRQGTLKWINGDSGNVPFINFIIEYSVGEDSSDWIKGWNAKPSDVSKNRTYVYYTVGGLQPDTFYRFRIIAENRVGLSPASPPSIAKRSNAASADSGKRVTPVYNQTWFLVTIALLAVVILFVLIACLVLQGRRKKLSGQRSERSTIADMNTLNTLTSLEMSLARSTHSRTPGSIRSAGLRNGSVTQGERTSEQNSEASSLGPKPEISDSEHEMSEGEMDAYKEKKKMDLAFVGHYGNNPTHKSWKNTLGRKGTPTQPHPDPYDDDQLTLGGQNGSLNDSTSDRYLPDRYMRLDSSQSPYIEDHPVEVTTSFMANQHDPAYVNDTYVHSPGSPPPRVEIPSYNGHHRPIPSANSQEYLPNGVRFEPRNDSFRRALVTQQPGKPQYSDSPPDYLSSLERRNMAQPAQVHPAYNQPTQQNTGSLTRNPETRNGRPPNIMIPSPRARPTNLTPQSPAPPYNGYQPDPYDRSPGGGRASPAPTYRSHESRGSDEHSHKSDEQFLPKGYRDVHDGPPRRPVYSPPPAPPPNIRYMSNSRGEPQYEMEYDDDDSLQDDDDLRELQHGNCSSFV